MKRLIATLGCLPLVIAGGLAQEGSNFAIEFGYRGVDINGNEDVFRSQYNYDDDFVLRSLTYNIINPEDGAGLFDRMALHASGFGSNPNGFLKLDVANAAYFDLALTYMRMEQYNALPAYANPFLDQGVTPGQHTLDRTRQTLDMEIEFLPGKRFRPILGFRWNDYNGPGTTTYHVGEDEFSILNDRDESETELRLGLAFDLGRFSGELIQGWRSFSGTDDLSFDASQFGDGNNLREVLGEDITLDALQSTTNRDADTPTTTFNIAGQLHDRVQLAAAFVMSDLESKTDESESLSGNLASFQISRFYNGSDQTIRSETDGDQWLGRVQGIISLPAGYTWRLGYSAVQRELDGQALIDTLYMDAITFGNNDPHEFITQLDARNHMERDQSKIETSLASPKYAGFSFWLGGAITDLDVDIDQDLAEIVVPGGQEGEFNRQIDTIRFGLAYQQKGLDARVSLEKRDADNPIMRTDFTEWQKLSAKVGIKLGSFAKLGGRAQWIDQDNEDDPEINLMVDHTQYGVDLNFFTKSSFNARLSYGIYDYESEIQIIQPQDFSTVPSIHREDGTEWEADLVWTQDKWFASANAIRYDSEGVLGFNLDRTGASVGYQIAKAFRATLEYQTYEYEEDALPIANYDADIYAILFRWQP